MNRREFIKLTGLVHQLIKQATDIISAATPGQVKNLTYHYDLG